MINLKTIFLKKEFYHEIVMVILLFLAAFLYFSYGYNYLNVRVYHYEEGIVAHAATFILNGGILYRDFFIHEFPGQYYLQAAVFKILGTNLHVMRIFAMVVLSLLTCLIYIGLKKFTRKAIAFLGFFLILAWLKANILYGRAPQTATLFAILSCFAMIKFIYSGRNSLLIITGIFAGITTLFRQDFGFYTFIALFMVLFLHQLESYEYKNWMVCFKSVFIKTFYLLLGIILAILPLVSYFIKIGILKEFTDYTIIFPLEVLIKRQLFTFPHLTFSNVVFYFPPVIFLLAFLKLLKSKWNTKNNDYKRDLCLMLFTLSGIGFFNYFRFHYNITHFIYTMVFAIIISMLLLEDSLRNRRFKYPIFERAIDVAVLLISTAVLFYPIISVFRQVKIASQKESMIDINRARGFYDNSQMAQSQALAIRYIQDKTSPEEKIFVGNSKHDRVVVGDSIFYFLAERNSATKYCRIDIGTTFKDRQEEIIKDIKKNNARYIVLCSVFTDDIDLYGSFRSSGINDLDIFIQENYKVEKIFGPYTILKRKINFNQPQS